VRRRDLLGLVSGAAALRPFVATTQAQKLPIIGVLLQGSEEAVPQLLPRALRDLGYVDGQNVRLEFRSAERDGQRLSRLAAEMVARKVDIIVAPITSSVLAAQQATSEIPIVMTYVADPVGAGIVASLPHPGGNVTGLSSMAAQETAGKQVELLSEAVPSAARFAVLAAAEPFGRLLLEQTVRAGTLRRIEIVPSVVSAATELDAAIAALAERKADGLIIQGFLSSPQLAALALRYRLPSVSQHPAFARQGGLIGHFASPNDSIRRAAVFVDKILKGANPADLPVEQPTKFELVINLKTAKALGLTLPPSLLARADEIIE
jgi:ABC-type uncharacterized transport system substrate-binding protein